MEAVWAPSQEVLARAHVTRFMGRHGVGDYAELIRRSIDDPDWYWPAVVEDMGLEFFTPWTQLNDLSRGPEWPTWFVGGTLNVAWNSCHRWARGEHAGRPALRWRSEDGLTAELTYAEYSREVTRLAEGLVRLGIEPGDRVGICMPMAPEAAIASHACAHCGAVQVPIFSGYAAPSIRERLLDAEVKVVITANASLRRGRELRMKETIDEALREVPSVEHVVVWRRAGLEVPMTAGRDHDWADLVASSPGTMEPLALDSEHPYILAYTSGTTGRPKGVVLTHAGFLVPIAAHNYYLTDIHPEDVMLFITDMGWVMGPWTVMGGGFCGCTLVYLEGAPDYPEDRLWQAIETERVSVLGISPTVARALMRYGDPRPDLSTLRAFITTGEPWNFDPYMWLFERVGGGRCPIINCSGGTEAGVFLTCSVAHPIKACSVGLPAPGQAMDVFDEDGKSVRVGVGELVCRKPWPSVTRGFWRDEQRYIDTYWRRYPGVWAHGDWASVDEDGCWFLHGRSDDTINVAGKRVGPAEIESAAVAHPAVVEAAAIGIPHDVKGEAIWVFCCLTDPSVTEPGLGDEILDGIAATLGKAFRPDRMLFVPALPKTRSQKIVRRAIRAAVLGLDPGDMSAVENPETMPSIVEVLTAAKAAM
jgi:acetyl-CoA synthetase